MRSNIIIVANRLPFSISEGSDGLVCQPSPGGMASALGPVCDRYNATWIGWAGLDRTLTATERAQLEIPSYAHDVHIQTEAYDDYYHRVANGALWPILHGMTPRDMYTAAHWESNIAVNKQFAKRIADIAKPNDVIWIHDFHLVMLPEMLKKIGVLGRIGFFLHVPVADTQLLTRLPNWPSMLQSLSCVDMLGVQTKRDATKLKQSFTDHSIALPRIANFPIGINSASFASADHSSAVQRHDTSVRAEAKNKTVILSVSRLDYTKGIVHQLQAIDALLKARPDCNILYKLIVAPSREALSEYRDVKKAVDKLVARIHAHHPHVVAYEYRSVGIDEIMAWYKRADIMLITPIIDGMNLVAKEYVATRREPGVLVLSNTAGAAHQLKEALLIDPTDVSSTVKALKSALSMPIDKRAQRHEALRKNVTTEDVFTWSDTFLATLYANHPSRRPRRRGRTIAATD